MATSGKNIEQLTETFLTEGLSLCEQAELQEFLKVDENKVYFKKMYTIWYSAHHSSDKENVEQALRRVLLQLNRKQLRKQTKSGWFIPFGKMAAAVLISFTLGLVFYHIVGQRTYNSATPATFQKMSKVTAPLGSRSQVELSDGTLVALNAGSSLRYPDSFGGKNREVWLEGEGYFKVVTNTAIPFVVQAKDVTIQAFGTEFNVKAYPEEKTVQTTLVNGQVSIRQTNTLADTKEIILKPRQTVTIHEPVETIRPVKDVIAQPATGRTPDRVAEEMVMENTVLTDNINTEQYTSWKDARWVIESEPLEELTVKLQRRYDVQIIITDDALKQYPFNGILADETMEQVLEIMKSIAPINYTIRKKTVTLSINPHQKKFFDDMLKQY